LKTLRQYAYDGVRRPANAQRLAHRVWIAPKAPAPQAVADQHRIRSTEPLLERTEIAPQGRSDAQHLQKTRRNQRHLELLGKFAGEFRNVLKVVAGNGLQGVVQAVPLLQANRRDRRFLVPGAGLSQLRKLIAIWKWQGPE